MSDPIDPLDGGPSAAADSWPDGRSASETEPNRSPGPADDASDETDGVAAPGADLGPDQGEMRERRRAGRRGARRGGPSVVTISWRDIPAQLTARSGDDQQKVLLHARFQHAIDRAAAVAGLTSTNDYVQEWRSTPSPLADGDVAAQLDQRCAELEARYPRERLEALVANGGSETDRGDGRAVSETHERRRRRPRPPGAVGNGDNAGTGTDHSNEDHDEKETP